LYPLVQFCLPWIHPSQHPQSHLNAQLTISLSCLFLVLLDIELFEDALANIHLPIRSTILFPAVLQEVGVRTASVDFASLFGLVWAGAGVWGSKVRRVKSGYLFPSSLFACLPLTDCHVDFRPHPVRKHFPRVYCYFSFTSYVSVTVLLRPDFRSRDGNGDPLLLCLGDYTTWCHFPKLCQHSPQISQLEMPSIFCQDRNWSKDRAGFWVDLSPDI
jgi:hypothetical protein